MVFRGLFVVLLVGVVGGGSMAAGDDASKGSIVVIDEGAPGAILTGSSQVNSNHLTCTFYDLLRDRSGRSFAMQPAAMNDSVLKYIQSDWQASKLSRYYRSPMKRYATAVMIPPVDAQAVPTVFGEIDSLGIFWLLVYEGSLVHPDGITFRFRGAAEDGIAVRVDDRVVFCDKVISGKKGTTEGFSKVWKSNHEQTGKFYLGHTPAVVGDWITLEPGVPTEIKIVVAEGSDGVSSAMLLVEEKGVRYPENQQGGPVLPPFKMDMLSLDLIDQICMGLPAGEALVDGGPRFGAGSSVVSNTVAAVPDSLMMDESSGSGLRIWTGDNGSVLEARVEGISGNMVVLKDAAGKKRRIPIDRLSKADQRYIELVHKQQYAVTFEVKKELIKRAHSPYTEKVKSRFEYTFSTTAKQLRSAKKTNDLVGELYVLTGEQNGGASYILVAREERPFVSRRIAGPVIDISMKPLSVIDEMYRDESREEDEFIYLFVIKDTEGTVISHSASEDWLFPNLGKLQQQPVGAFLDPFCNRVRPTHPEPTHY